MSGPIALPGAPLPISTGPRAPAQTPAIPDDIRRAAEEFEAVFLSEMLGPMFESLGTDGLGGGGMGEQMFRPMLVQRYAEAISKAGGVGIADAVMREMLRMQGQTIAPEAADGADR
jgi:Rod binding domain-containing protein